MEININILTSLLYLISIPAIAENLNIINNNLIFFYKKESSFQNILKIEIFDKKRKELNFILKNLYFQTNFNLFGDILIFKKNKIIKISMSLNKKNFNENIRIIT